MFVDQLETISEPDVVRVLVPGERHGDDPGQTTDLHEEHIYHRSDHVGHGGGTGVSGMILVHKQFINNS